MKSFPTIVFINDIFCETGERGQKLTDLCFFGGGKAYTGTPNRRKTSTCGAVLWQKNKGKNHCMRGSFLIY